MVRVCDALKRNLEVYWTQRASVDAALHPGTVPAIGVNRAGGITLIVQDAVKKEALQALKVLKAVEQDRGRIYQWQGITVNLLSQAQPKEVRNHSWLA